MVQRGSGDQHQSTIGPDQAAPVSNAKNNNNTNSLFYNGQSVRVPGMGLGKSYMGLVCTTQRLLVKRQGTGWGGATSTRNSVMPFTQMTVLTSRAVNHILT